MTKPVYTFNGITRTMSEWSRVLDVPVRTLYNRLKAGVAPQFVFTSIKWPNRRKENKPKRPRLRPGALTYKGISATVTEWADMLDLHKETIRQRLERGLSPEYVFNARRYPRAKKYLFRGKSLTIKEWSDHLGVPVATLRARLTRGLPHEHIFTRKLYKPNEMRATTYAHNGRSLTLKQWSEELGVPYVTLYMRIRKGMTLDRALTHKPKRAKAQRNGAKYEANGRSLTIPQWAELTGLTYASIYKRLHRGQTLASIIAGRVESEGPPSGDPTGDVRQMEGGGLQLCHKGRGPAGDRNNRSHEIEFSENQDKAA